MTRPQQVRDECLVQLYGSGPLWLSVEHLWKVAHQQQFDFDRHEMLCALQFLSGQGMAESRTDEASGEVRYRITSKGILHFENER
jgi:hypothetical protein